MSEESAVSGRWDAPAPDEIEISLFGAGFGESAVVHVGDGSWVVIDSLRHEGESVPLRYLEGLGVDVSTHVTHAVVTHWHADHIGGMSDLIAAAASAEVVLPGAFSIPRFVDHLKFRVANENEDLSTFSEIARIGTLAHAPGRPAVSYARNTVRVLTKQLGKEHCGITLTALSPSARDVQLFIQSLADAIEAPAKGVRRSPAFDENLASIALWLEVGDDACLLGADIETKAANDRGWRAIVDSPHRSQVRGTAYKVAHHGGESGHFDQVYSALLAPNPLSLITPYNKKGGLPTQRDKERLLGRSDKNFITVSTIERRYKDSGAGESKGLEAFGITIADTNKLIGQVRIRKSISNPKGPWTVSLYDGAVDLAKYVPRS